MRDSILKYLSEPKGESLCTDIIYFCENSTEKPALVVWGDPLDPYAWEVSIGFLRKWGFLLKDCSEILYATDYWRERRGGRKISFVGLV
jgi:hypothetical protein